MIGTRLLLALTLTTVAMGTGPLMLRGQQAAPQAPGADPAAGLTVRNLKEFGPVRTVQEAEATYKKALSELTAAQGGTLYVPEDVPLGARLENNARWSHSTNPPSCDLRDWKVGPGVMVIDNRAGNTALRVPQLGQPGGTRGGITLERTLRLPSGDSLQHWTEESIVNIENNIVHGPCNYLDWITEPVKAGKDARFYLPQVRNLFKGMYLNAHQGPGYAGVCARITVKDLGYDQEKKAYFFTADTITDHVAGAIVQNKSHTPAINVVHNYNAANQTWDAYFKKNMYADGDSEMFHVSFDYMGNVHSMAGDENGGCIVAHVHSLLNVFRGTVESADPAAHKLVFKAARNPQTLGNSRPLINLNQKKWVNAGKVYVVPCESYWDLIDTGRYPYKGKTYPTVLLKNPKTGVSGLRMGGLIRGDKDCPWDASLIGRFFAVNEPSECIEEGSEAERLRRWYEIVNVSANPDGTKDLTILRFWWGAKEAGSPTLYNPDNLTYDGHERPLSYVIAVGAYVNDVSGAVMPGSPSPHPARTLSLTPYPALGTALAFAADDPIEQAMGPDPFRPQPFRAWTFDAVPGAWPAAMLDLANHGPIQRTKVLSIAGGPDSIEGCRDRKDKSPAWKSVMTIDSACEVGLECNADFADAAILFKQPYREQPLKWYYGDRKVGEPFKEATLTVSKETGNLVYKGGSIQAQGLSGEETAARNLRGKNVAIKAGETAAAVTFPVAEADGDYAVLLELSWLSNRAVAKKEGKGFTVQFDKPAPEGATLDWMIVR